MKGKIEGYGPLKDVSTYQNYLTYLKDCKIFLSDNYEEEFYL